MTELIDRVDELIQILEQDEHKFFVILDIAHQLRDEIQRLNEFEQQE